MIIYLDIETVSSEGYKDKHIDKYGERINFMPELNKIITICLGTETKDGIVVKNLEGGEYEQIQKFFEAIKGNKICGFNIKKFDIPFIIKRALHYKITIPNDLKIFGKKPWEIDNIIDLQEIYSYGIFGSIGNMDLISDFLGLDNPKSGIDGSMVQKFYDEGKISEIIDYCKRDVLTNIQLHKYFISTNLI